MTNAGVVTAGANAVQAGMLNDDIISGQGEMTGDVEDTDELLISDAGTIKRADFSVVRDAVFNDVSGDAEIAAGGALTILDNAVSLAKLAHLNRGSIIYGAGADGVPYQLAPEQMGKFLHLMEQIFLGKMLLVVVVLV